jgi:hypothetical protein
MRSWGSNLVKDYIIFYEFVFRGEDMKGDEMSKLRRIWWGEQEEILYARYKHKWGDNIKMYVKEMG